VDKKCMGGLLLCFIWAGMGFLVGLTGSVIAAPKYRPVTEDASKLVYNTGLQAPGSTFEQIAVVPEKTDLAGTEEIFVKRGCIQCHPVSFYGIKGGETGPDLSIAYYDVPDRFGKTLEEFLWEPEGTMGSIIPDRGITEAEKYLILDLLRKAAGHETSLDSSSGGEKASN